jgi:hypothetical protein
LTPDIVQKVRVTHREISMLIILHACNNFFITRVF